MRAFLLLLWSAGAQARDADVLAFSRDGSQVLLESWDHDREEGGSSVRYVVIGGKKDVAVEPNDTRSHGAGRQQHVSPKDCLAAVSLLEAALRGFSGVKIHRALCRQKERAGLVEVEPRPGIDFEARESGLQHGELTLRSEAERLVLLRAGAEIVSFAVRIPKESLAATLSPTGKLLLLRSEDGIAAIAESKSGRPEDFALRKAQ